MLGTDTASYTWTLQRTWEQPSLLSCCSAPWKAKPVRRPWRVRRQGQDMAVWEG